MGVCVVDGKLVTIVVLAPQQSAHFYEGLIETALDERQKLYIVGHQRGTQVEWQSSPLSELLLRFLRTCRQ